MNEQKLKELWWKARIGYNEQNCDPEVLEKFAELIVGECADICVRFGESGDGYTCSARILKHFGVEE